MPSSPSSDPAPSVAVLLAARDVAAFLPETLRSLDAQTEPAFHLVAVDDGSTDGTGAILDAHSAVQDPARPVTVIRTGGVGLAAARNRALAATDAPVAMILDGDDVLAPDLLARARAALRARPELDLVFPLCDHVDAAGRPLGVRSPLPRGPLTPARSLLRPPIHTDSGVVVRRAALLGAGGFDPALTGCIGLDAWYRVLSLRPGNGWCLPEPLVRYRRRAGQISGSAARMERNMTAFLAARMAGDPSMPAPFAARVLAAHRLYWASLAYAEGDDAAARAYTAAAWRGDPAGSARSPYAYARAAISLASLLPDRLHHGLRRAALRARAWRG